MRIHALSLSLLLAVACGKPAAPPPAAPAAANPEAEAAASCRVTASIAPAAIPSGGEAKLTIEIAMTRADVHVQKEFPLKVSLAPSAGLSAAKATLGHADAVDGDAKGRRWEVPLVAKASGRQEVQASLRFAVCKETEPAWCVTRTDSVRAGVEVR
jgi:hypothetical protein